MEESTEEERGELWMMEASKLTTVSGLRSHDIPWSVYKGEGRTRQDQPGILGYTGGQMPQHKHCAVIHVLKEQGLFFFFFRVTNTLT